jgi:hypothetical protein
MSLRIKIHESKQAEAQGLVFLPENLKSELEFELPTLYTAKGLAVFKGKEEVEPDAAWDVENMSWDVDAATVSGNYLMVAFRDNPGAETVKSVMADEYKKAVLPEALELVAYLDVEALRDVYDEQIVKATKGKDYELGYYMGDIIDMGDVPGGIDNAYTEDGEVSCMVGAFGFSVAEAINGSEIKDTQSTDEALKLVEELYSKYKD